MSSDPQREKLLKLPDGRVLAYEENGNTDSRTIVIFFHGIFGVGGAKDPSPAIIKHDAHYVAPTLPGWGNSSIRAYPQKTPYYHALAQDITALLEHLHPGCSAAPAREYKLYISGGSYGTVAAQMIFNASLDTFPAGKHIVTGLLLAPATLSASVVLSRKLKRPEGAEKLIKSLIFDHLTQDEELLSKKWREETGLKDCQLEKGMAASMCKSVSKSWEGFIETADVMHGDWGFTLEEMSPKPIVIGTSKGDKITPAAWGQWLAGKYPNAKLKEIAGSHIAGLWIIDSIWEEVMSNTE